MDVSGSRARYWASVFGPLIAMGVVALFVPWWVTLVAVVAILAWPRR